VALEPTNQAFTGSRRGRAQVQVGYEQTAHGPNPTRSGADLSVVWPIRSRLFRPERPDGGMSCAS
jgi:hypothetical protein